MNLNLIHLSEHFMMVHWTELFKWKKGVMHIKWFNLHKHVNELIYKKSIQIKNAFFCYGIMKVIATFLKPAFFPYDYKFIYVFISHKSVYILQFCLYVARIDPSPEFDWQVIWPIITPTLPFCSPVNVNLKKVWLDSFPWLKYLLMFICVYFVL